MMLRHAMLFRIVCEETGTIRRAVLRAGVPLADVPDVMQTVLLTAWRAIVADRFSPPKDQRRQRVRAWLREVARTASRNAMRGRRHLDPLEDHEDALAGPDPVPRIIKREELLSVTFRLNRVETSLVAGLARGETVAEMATRTRMPFGTVATKIRAIRRTLRKHRAREK